MQSRNCGNSSALDAPAAAELTVELDQAAKAMERRRVLIAVARGEHAGEVSGRCDRRTEALAERFAVRGARRSSHPRVPSGVSTTVTSPRGVTIDVGSPASNAGPVAPICFERRRQPTQVLGPRRRNDFDVVDRLSRPVDDAREPADDDERHTAALQSGGHPIGSNAAGRPSVTPRSLSDAPGAVPEERDGGCCAAPRLQPRRSRADRSRPRVRTRRPRSDRGGSRSSAAPRRAPSVRSARGPYRLAHRVLLATDRQANAPLGSTTRSS